jgi:hypothetical protein
MFVELWAEIKATPRLFESRNKDIIKELETFVTTDCLRVLFFLPFVFCLLSHFSCTVPAVLLILINELSELKSYRCGYRLVNSMS